MNLPNSIVQASDQLKLDVTAENASPRLVLTTWRAKNEPNWMFEEIAKLIKSHHGDIVATTSTMEKGLDYGGWFNYFFKEAREIEGNDVAFGRIASLLFKLDVSEPNKVRLPGKLPLKPQRSFVDLLSSSPGGLPFDVLNFLFRTGFKKASMADASNVFSKDLALKANVNEGALIQSTKGEFVFGYRGDTRDPATVIAHKGATCRAELDFWRKDNNIDKDWHPWNRSKDDVLDGMWFREGSKDNDYFTLNSMAMDFHIACAYPMFRSFEIHQNLRGPVSKWGYDKRSLLKGNQKGVKIVRVKRTGGKIEEVLADTGCIYICAFASNTQVAKTWEKNSYPESGVRNVGLGEILAYVKISRYQHPPESDQHHYDSTRIQPSMTICVDSWKWVRTEEETRATLGCTKDGIKVVAAKLQNLVGKRFDISHTKVYSTATYDPDVPVNYQPAEISRVTI